MWSMDFVSDSLVNGRRLKCLTVADDFSHECVDIAVDYGIGGQYVTRLLDQAAIFRGYPKVVRTDNGPEFTSRAFMGWVQCHGIRHLLIEPGRPMQNGYIESFNGKFRDECLNEHWFQSMHQARFAIAEWRRDYNEVRPHSSIGRIPPARFAELHRRGAAMRFIHPLTLESTKLATRTSTLRLVRQQGAGQSPLSPTKPASARRVALWRTLTGYFKAWSPCIFPLLHL